MKKLIIGIGLFSVLACNTLSAKEAVNDLNKRSQSTSNSSIEAFTEAEYSQDQLAQMLAPIALYPDSLLTHILIASTYPIEVIEAERWISKNENLYPNIIAERLESKTWDASVKALVMFPNVLERLSDDLSWTQELGSAFLQNEGNVLQAIQHLRYQAKRAGSLDKMENVEVSRKDSNIIIEPIEKEIVYVPYYDSRHVYGRWHSLLYPPIYWDWGHRVSYSKHRPFGWHAGIHISWNYFFSAFHWSNRHVVVINHRNTRYYNPKRHIVRSGYSNRWVHKPVHRKGLRYSHKQVNKRYSSNRALAHNKKVIRNEHRHKRLVNHNVKTVKRVKHDALKNKLKAQKKLSQQKHKNKSQQQYKKQLNHKAPESKKFNSQRTVVKQNKTYKSNNIAANKKVKQTRQVKSVNRERVVRTTSRNTQRNSVGNNRGRSHNQGQRQSRRVERN
jgi:hypothetical protein